jgi:hypothetical protein
MPKKILTDLDATSRNITAGTFNKMAITAPSTGSTLAITNLKIFSVSNTLTLAGTDSTTMTFPSTSSTVMTLAQPGTLTGSVTLRAGTATAGTAPLYLQAGTNLTSPVYGAFESTTDGIFLTNNPGATSTGPGRGVITAPQMVFSKATVTTNAPAPGTYTVNAFAAANDVLSVLEPAKLYRFRAKYYLSTSFGSGTYSVTTPLTFSNAPATLKYSFKTYPETAGSALTRLGAGTSVTIAPLATSLSASVTTVVEIDGYFDSHATLTSTLTPQLTCQINSGSTTASITAGSWFEIEKLGTSTQTLIAGNWS